MVKMLVYEKLSYLIYAGLSAGRTALSSGVVAAGAFVISDLYVQFSNEKRSYLNLDFKRILRLALFGLLLKGPIMDVYMKYI